MPTVAVVGGGAVGCAIARELSKFSGARVVLLEKEDDLSQGATKANSGIVHGGYDAKHGTLKSKLSRRGNRKFAQLDQELNFGYREIGSLVLAFTDLEVKDLEKLAENGRLNGVNDLEIIDGKQVREMEPHVSVGVKAALHCPTAGIVSPYEYCYALAENAMANGVEVHVGAEVTGIERLRPLRGGSPIFRIETRSGYTVDADFVVNAAGLFSDEIARMAGAGLSYKILPRKGQYILLEKSQGHMASRVIFQTPTVRWGKGILVSPTFAGALLLGPSASEQQDKLDKSTDMSELAYVAWAARRSVPHLDTRENLTTFSGLRARGPRSDFMIEEDTKVPRFVHVAAIESPGLTSSPAIAEMVREILQGAGLALEKKDNFQPSRRHPVRQLDLGVNPSESDKEIVCTCEQISRGAIRQAIRQAGIPITSTDSVKWRTRAGMGHCQGARCRAEVAEIVAQELDNDVSFQDVPKRVKSAPEPARVARKDLSKL
ncbi:L-2-hydroxyglutarate dehydrogenase, mitochondrial [Hondaea fermentalgiana]|uniref:L-2-hydroxyglutarate dehydrogenase, mitochondrial n=1 Tax=Hondaea fermentalgiana TaxID=2315210 RepID=A0A2R5G043_9STRA|nr:L-2-hydroxyglutarate dehydrogenase, mitochondrial [Hondaea fermentalgiana]|eukprot:GBG24382.1 L-2-hydroxyglutarate dehydrogenase, mitochondrial [Hondaea fermentalgiana]